MAVTATVTDVFDVGKRLVAEGTLAFTGNYATGGPALSFAGLVRTSKFGSPTMVIITNILGFQVVYDNATGKVLVFIGDNNNASDGPGVEAPDATAFSTIGITAARFQAWFKKP